ncbi:MAG: hypothetical protein ACJAYN_003168 [Bermanella sp.]|jgi:hypothetical protein
MKTEKRKKTIYYKRASFTTAGATLQSMLISALASSSPAAKAKFRREILNLDDESCRLINHHTDYSGMTFGQLVFFESGRSQTLITLDDDAEFYEINAITPNSIDINKDPKKTNQSKREFIDSLLYFGVLDNHVVILQSAALKARELETHLHWLLGTCTSYLDSNSALILKDKLTEETIQRMEKTPVKSVHLGTPLESKLETVNLDDEKPIEGTAKKVKWIPCGMGVDVVRAALGENWFNRLELEDSLDEANLQVSLEITYLRKTTQNGQKMLDNIATSLRNLEESDVKVELYGGGTIKGSELKLSGGVNVKTNNGIVDESDLYHQMHAWIVEKVHSNEIEVESESGT